MNPVLTDPFGVQIRIDDQVFFAGADYNRKPTLNKGYVEKVNLVSRRVLVRRTVRSGNAVADSTERLIWVEVAKVGVVLP